MSFSSDVKLELCNIENKRRCCERAEGYGLLLFSKCFDLAEKAVSIENPAAARSVAGAAASAAGVIPQLQANLRWGGYVLSIPGSEQRRQLLAAFGHGSGPLVIRQENLERPCCAQAFLRGAFVCCGSVTDPDKGYQLEFVVPQESLAEALGDYLLQLPDLAFQPGLSRRQGSHVVYFKDSAQIENLLTFMGARQASMSLMQTKMYKEAVANINRQSNFETANIDKTLSASARQTAAIALLSDLGRLEELGADLQAVARLRLHHPQMTLKEMSQTLDVSRSGVNHRLQRLIALAEDCDKDGILQN